MCLAAIDCFIFIFIFGLGKGKSIGRRRSIDLKYRNLRFDFVFSFVIFSLFSAQWAKINLVDSIIQMKFLVSAKINTYDS